MTTKISTSNIRTTTLENLGGSPTISNVQITNSSYTVLDDTAISLDGGYIKITGTKFASGCTVVVNRTSATSVTFVSATEIRAQLPALVAGTYVMYVINPDSSVAIRVNAITYSATPTWVTSSTLPTGAADQAISINLNASGASTYSVQAGSTLPTGLTLASNGLLSGTITGLTQETTYNFNIVATDAELQDSPRSFSITITAGDQYFKDTVLLLSGTANTFVKDSSSNNHGVAVVGDTRPYNFSPYTPGRYSVYFDTKTDYISVPATTALTTFTGDFTLEAWIYPTDTSVGNWKFWDSRQDGGTGNPMVFGLTSITTGQGKLEYFNGNYNQGTGVVYYNRWTHVAFVRSGSTLTYYVDGVAGGTSTISGTQTGTATSNPVIIGTKDSGVSGYGILGYISNLRMVNGTAVYTSNFTPSTEPLTAITNTVLLTCQGNRYIDNSANAYTMLPNGVGISSFSPFTSDSNTSTFGSAYFDGTGDYLTVSNSNLALGSGDFTLECWINAPSGLSDKAIFEGRSAGDGTAGFTLTAFSNTSIRIFSGSALITSGSINYVNTWCHVAVVRASGTTTLYINGVSQGTTTSLGNLTDSSFVIGAGKYALPPNIDAFFTGYISNFRIVKGTAVYTTNFTPPTAPLTAISGTSLLTLQSNVGVNNNYILDYSSVNNTVTRFGNTTQGSFSPYSPYNWSNYFDGDGDYLTAPGSSSFNLSSGNWTIECWVYTTASKLCTIVSQGGSTWRIQQNGTSIVYNAATDRITGSIAANLNTWNHIALVSNSGTITLYINGTSAGTTTAYPVSNNTDTIYIGINPEAASWAYPGYISNLRIVKDTAVYTSNFVPSSTPLPLIPGTSLLTCADSRLIDESANTHVITKNGDVRITNFTPFKAYVQTSTSYSTYFDGTGDYLTATGNTTLNPGTQDFTVECWVYRQTTDATNRKAIATTRPVSGTLAGWVIFVETTGYVGLGGWNSAGTLVLNYSSTTNAIVNNTWTHVAVVKVGNNFTIYVNGAASGTGTASATLADGPNFYIGTEPQVTTRDWNGYISNFRIVKGTALYTSNFTPATAPLTAVSGTSLLTCQSTSLIDISANAYSITGVANARVVLFNPFGTTFAITDGYVAAQHGASMYFDGSGDYISGSTTFAPRTGVVTIEAWIYVLDRTGGRCVVTSRSGNTSDGFQILVDSGGEVRVGYAGANFISSAANTVVVNQWYHIAVTRNTANLMTLWVNGVASGTSTRTNDFTNATFRVGLTAEGNNPMSGYVSGVRIVNRNLYTSNFLPPTAPVLDVQGTTLLLNATNGSIVDATTKNMVETVGEVKVTSALSKFGGSSIYLDGSGDYLNIPDNTNIRLGAGDFTIEGWFWFDGNQPNYTLFSKASSYELKNDTNRWVLQINTNNKFVTNFTVSPNVWYHIALVRNGSNTVLYLNGNSYTNGTSENANDNTSPLVIGNGGGGHFKGYIQDFRITKGFARYTGNFTPPATAHMRK